MNHIFVEPTAWLHITDDLLRYEGYRRRRTAPGAILRYTNVRSTGPLSFRNKTHAIQ